MITNHKIRIAMKYIVSCLVLVGSLALFTSNAQAQDASTTQISSFATVTGDFAVEARRDLNFGFILANSDEVTITPASDNAGQFYIVTGQDLQVTITATPLFLDGGDGSETQSIPFTHFESVRIINEATGNFSDVSGIRTEDGVNSVLTFANFERAGAQRFDMFVGGTISTDDSVGDDDDDRENGVYEGTITVVLEEVSGS